MSDKPTTVADCQREYQQAQAQRAENAGAARDQLASATSAQPHTHRR